VILCDISQLLLQDIRTDSTSVASTEAPKNAGLENGHHGKTGQEAPAKTTLKVMDSVERCCIYPEFAISCGDADNGPGNSNQRRQT
jgi:hypothetical protein